MCQAPNAFICVSPNAFLCVSPNAFLCVSPNASADAAELTSLAYLCSLRSLVFKQSKLEFLYKEHACPDTDSCLNTDSWMDPKWVQNGLKMDPKWTKMDTELDTHTSTQLELDTHTSEDHPNVVFGESGF